MHVESAMPEKPIIAILNAPPAEPESADIALLEAAAKSRGYGLLPLCGPDAADAAALLTADLLVVMGQCDGEDPIPAPVRAALDRERVPVLHLLSGAKSAEFRGADDVMFGRSVDELDFRLRTLLDRRGDLARLRGERDNLQRLCGVLRENMLSVEQEMLFARRLQMALIPKTFDHHERLEVYPYFRPAGEVSGDIYGQIPLANGRIGLFLADAVGHGIAAALLTVFVRGSICARAAAGNGHLPDPADALAQTNTDILDAGLEDGQYVTMAYLIIDPITCKARLALGGHPPPLLLEPDGSIHELKARGTLVGMFEEARYESIELTLTAGQTILLYSDGADAALSADPEQEIGALRRELTKLAGQTPVEIIETLAARMDALPGSLNPRDDVTLLAIQCVK